LEGQSEQQLDFLKAVESFASNTVASAAVGWSMGQNPEAAVFDQAARLGLMGIQAVSYTHLTLPTILSV